MSTRDKFEDKIRKKEQEIAEYEAKIREARVYIQALQDSIKLLPRESNGYAERITLRQGSMAQKTYELLKNAGRPMRNKEILINLNIEPSRENLATLRGSLGSYIRENNIFMSPAPGVVGLIGFKYDTEQISFNDNKEGEKEN